MPEILRICPLIGRILIASLFVPEGFDKIMKFRDYVAYTAQHNFPLPAVSVGLALVIELGLGLALLIGYRARFAAAGIALFCIVAALGFHTNFSDMNEQINFFKDLAIAGGLLQLVYFGAGPFSVDNRR